MVDFRAALKRPFSDKKTLVVSFLLALISVVLSPILVGLLGILLLLGFAGATAKNSIDRRKTLAEWHGSNLGEFFFGGLRIFLIKLVYGLIGLIIIVIAITTFTLAILSGSLDSVTLSSAIIGSGTIFLVGLALLLLGLLFVPMAIMNYLSTGSLKDAFAIGKVIRKTLSLKFFGALIFVIAYAILLSLIGSIIAVITIGIGTLLLPGIFLYLYTVCMFEVFAEVFKETK